MNGAAWKWSGATWIAFRKLRSIQATLAIIPAFAESEISSQAPSHLTRPHGIRLVGPLDFADLAGKILAAQKWNIPEILNSNDHRFNRSNRQISDPGMRNQARLGHDHRSGHSNLQEIVRCRINGV